MWYERKKGDIMIGLKVGLGGNLMLIGLLIFLSHDTMISSFSIGACGRRCCTPSFLILAKTSVGSHDQGYPQLSSTIGDKQSLSCHALFQVMSLFSPFYLFNLPVLYYPNSQCFKFQHFIYLFIRKVNLRISLHEYL